MKRGVKRCEELHPHRLFFRAVLNTPLHTSSHLFTEVGTLAALHMEMDAGKSLAEVMASNPTADYTDRYGEESASLGFVNRIYTSLAKKR